MYNVELTHDGFDVTFTDPVDKASAGNVASYKMNTFRYIYRSEYGSPEVDPTTPTIKSATVSADGKSVHLVVDGLQVGSVHELHTDGVRLRRTISRCCTTWRITRCGILWIERRNGGRFSVFSFQFSVGSTKRKPKTENPTALLIPSPC